MLCIHNNSLMLNHIFAFTLPEIQDVSKKGTFPDFDVPFPVTGTGMTNSNPIFGNGNGNENSIKFHSFQCVSTLFSKFQMVEIHTSNSKFLLFRSKHFLGSKYFSKILISRYPYELSKFFEKLLSKMTIFTSNIKWKKEIQLFAIFLL